jgi:hypothetical protein
MILIIVSAYFAGGTSKAFKELSDSNVGAMDTLQQ